MVSTGYAIADLATLRAIPPDKRADGYAKLVVNGSNGNPAWYVFKEASTEQTDYDTIVLPDDNPDSGRFIKVGAINSGGGQTD